MMFLSEIELIIINYVRHWRKENLWLQSRNVCEDFEHGSRYNDDGCRLYKLIQNIQSIIKCRRPYFLRFFHFLLVVSLP